ncbi:MAG: class I SAM-dependent methyltransferase [Prochlorotrichaceae cyanobacterium]|jgi:SAM-dependent methyltransferase
MISNLNPQQRSKLDPQDDSLFYRVPRFVTHVDEGFIQQLTQLYRDRLEPNTRILDLMSSWVSHLPPEMNFAQVEGLGLNGEELAKNPRLTHFTVQDLNQKTQLPYPSASFNAILIAVSVQYLQQPEQVFSELYRLLQPGGLVIVSFSNRMFYQKAIQAWREGTERERVALVKGYFRSVPGFTKPETIENLSHTPALLQFLGLGSGDPFYAVISQRSQEQSREVPEIS